MTDAAAFFESDYAARGAAAQRRYPNEDLVRFFGRNYFSLPRPERADIRVLEAGCGSGGNLWMIAAEGFDTHGLDFSETAVALCRDAVAATVTHGDMTAMPYPDASFDVVIDNYAAYALDRNQAELFYSEVARLLKPGGRFFCYVPSTRSDMYRRARTRDGRTLDFVDDPKAPFHGTPHTMRFASCDELFGAFFGRGFDIPYMERVGRTYRNGDEYYEMITMEAVKRR